MPTSTLDELGYVLPLIVSVLFNNSAKPATLIRFAFAFSVVEVALTGVVVPSPAISIYKKPSSGVKNT